MKISLIILVIVCALSCGVARDAAKSTDQANLQGAWLAQSESQKGKKWNVSYLYVFRGDKLFFTDETGKEVTYSFKLDTTGSLKFIIIQPDGTLNISAPVSIAYELDGDSLKIVVAPLGLRPTEISDKNNQELIICKRKDS
ncbi:TIGR03067 domain-containing protein [Spirosoma terrae]|uniref:TIGR03067 domain-containing protein n=1 Tax=Spirosoma terrae TaxID=1968276 RepID=A0A6L9LDA4_9BACT|nr:TIGR03067 domain-containing protein [Spirosoma terrae]NDU96448.1 TIGR03067 domain-containing protein [Spirosoma terrae]